MTVKELKERFENRLDDEEVKFIIVNPKGKILWKSDNIDVSLFTHGVIPMIGVVVYESEPFDGEMVKAAEEDGHNSMWIPVGKRLPEPYKWVVATVKKHHWISDYNESTIADEEKVEHPEETFITLARCEEEGLWQYMDPDDEALYLADHADMEDLSNPREEVIAWMPLPEPYAEEETEV